MLNASRGVSFFVFKFRRPAFVTSAEPTIYSWRVLLRRSAPWLPGHSFFFLSPVFEDEDLAIRVTGLGLIGLGSDYERQYPSVRRKVLLFFSLLLNALLSSTHFPLGDLTLPPVDYSQLFDAGGVGSSFFLFTRRARLSAFTRHFSVSSPEWSPECYGHHCVRRLLFPLFKRVGGLTFSPYQPTSIALSLRTFFFEPFCVPGARISRPSS